MMMMYVDGGWGDGYGDGDVLGMMMGRWI